MTDVGSDLDRLVPLPDAQHQDWGDVLKRAGVPRRRARGALVVAFAIVLLAALLLVTPALGVHALFFGDEPTPTWTWSEGVPGVPVQPPEMVRVANESANSPRWPRVDLATLREVVSVGSGRASERILAARGVTGDVCLANVAGDGSRGGAFSCVDNPTPSAVVTPLQQGVFLAASGGGHRGSVVDYATVVGVVRRDVGLVELELQDGDTIRLPLNRWRGFGYSTSNPERLPKRLTVYRTWSSLFAHHEEPLYAVPLVSEDVSTAPLCGGKYGPCPEGVIP